MREDESRHGNVPNFDDPCEIAGQHVRATRHTRADCPTTHAAERGERDHEPVIDLDARALDEITVAVRAHWGDPDEMRRRIVVALQGAGRAL